MKKRVIALISAVVLIVSCFAVPTFAASEDYDSEYRITPYVADISAYNTGSVYNFASLGAVLINGYGIFADSLYSVTYTDVDVCLNSSGVLYLSFSNSVSGSADKFFVYGGSAKHQIYWTIGSSGSYFAAVTIRFNTASVSVSNQELFDLVFPNFYPSFTEEDLNNAYDEGYQAGISSTDPYQNGFTDGAASIDQESIRQEGYDDGYDVGFGDGAASIDQDAIRQEGYDNGYSSAMQLVGDLSGGLFKNMVLAMDVSLDVDGRTIVENFDNVPYDLITGGIYFRSTLNFLQTTFGDTWEDRVTQVVLRLQFEHGSISGQLPVDWSASPILISGSALVDSATLKTVDNVLYAMTAEDGSYGSLRNFVFNDPSDITYPVIYKEFSLKVGRPGDLLNEMTLWSNSEFYGTGYAAGYADGLSSDSADVYDKAYDEGHQVGYAVGKKEGLELSKTGDWKNLMLAVTEAPINTFQSLFNFEILGLDMRLAFGSILAVCVLLIIVKKVLL